MSETYNWYIIIVYDKWQSVHHNLQLTIDACCKARENCRRISLLSIYQIVYQSPYSGRLAQFSENWEVIQIYIRDNQIHTFVILKS